MGVKAVEVLLNGDKHHAIACSGGKIISMPIEEALAMDDTIQTLNQYEVFKTLW